MNGLNQGDRDLLRSGFKENAASITELTRELRTLNRNLASAQSPCRPAAPKV